MFALGNEELAKLPALGKTVNCKSCGGTHVVEFGKTKMPDGTWQESKMMAFTKCGGKTFLVGVEGKDITGA